MGTDRAVVKFKSSVRILQRQRFESFDQGWTFKLLLQRVQANVYFWRVYCRWKDQLTYCVFLLGTFLGKNQNNRTKPISKKWTLCLRLQKFYVRFWRQRWWKPKVEWSVEIWYPEARVEGNFNDKLWRRPNLVRTLGKIRPLLWHLWPIHGNFWWLLWSDKGAQRSLSIWFCHREMDSHFLGREFPSCKKHLALQWL